MMFTATYPLPYFFMTNQYTTVITTADPSSTSVYTTIDYTYSTVSNAVLVEYAYVTYSP
jgi:hypothetical protein